VENTTPIKKWLTERRRNVTSMRRVAVSCIIDNIYLRSVGIYYLWLCCLVFRRIQDNCTNTAARVKNLCVAGREDKMRCKEKHRRHTSTSSSSSRSRSRSQSPVERHHKRKRLSRSSSPSSDSSSSSFSSRSSSEGDTQY